MNEIFDTPLSSAWLPRARPGLDDAELHAQLEAAAGKVAPLWPLDSFVAVNPFVGLADLHFEQAARQLAATADARLVMARSFYGRALADGRMVRADLDHALATSSRSTAASVDVTRLTRMALASLGPSTSAQPCARPRQDLATVAELARRETGQDWPRFVRGRLEAWLESYADLGQASWTSPWREQPPFGAWRCEAMLDRSPELVGLGEFRERVRALPGDALSGAKLAIARLGLGAGELELYLDRLAASVAGWAGVLRQRGWHEHQDAGLAPVVELIVVRMVWDALLLELLDPALATAWTEQAPRFAALPSLDDEQEIDLLLHAAYEHATRRRLVTQLGSARSRRTTPSERAAVQAAFCIDVRSERLRRALERESETIETLGVAGFFGVAIEYRGFASEHGADHCPALITPSFTVTEAPVDADEGERERLASRARERRHLAGAWARLKQAAIASFSYVETLGIVHTFGLVADSIGRPAPPHHGPEDLAPALDPCDDAHGARLSGISLDERIELAAGLLASLSLRDDFARVVLLCGHAATTTNNPHARGLDCGACGGHSGGPNARIAARLLNDDAVRSGLTTRGLDIPADTLFVAGVHDTVTDVVTLLDDHATPASHVAELERLRAQLDAASARVRRERAPALGLDPERADAGLELVTRSRDWSEVRNEWGLAGCTAFVIAQRERTRGLDLDGRAFLHSYDWRGDEGFAVLETLMSAPMVVASWINLQYFASTVDHDRFGAGNKTLHNIVGQLGVAEGNGELRTGLPLQSVHDGERWVHDPARLSVVIEAPREAIDAVLAKHPPLRALVENEWLFLFALDDAGALRRREPSGRWVEEGC